MLFALEYFEHNINGHVFYDWCKFTLTPSLKIKCVVVVDNAYLNKNKRILKLLNMHCYRVLWLLPYGPDLNPVEKKWAQAQFLRQGWMENNPPKLFHDIGCIDFILN
ncbi:transposase [Kordiimonas sp.]|uniref:transposase n=1 Tax=Kordiimonas sp. TaxID=1970157 RepID=UPI003A930A10